MTDFGTDFSALPRLTFAQKKGLANLGEAIARRLMTPRGGLFYDPTYGLDLRRYLNAVNDEATRFEIEILSAAQCELDERVARADVTVLTLDLRSAEIDVSLTTLLGPFRLILAISQVRVEVLRAV
ncbi:hypothetical protein Q0M94_03405 [Deinococcus radiomollis]|uniref:hypothetical protein n=1 Tax=Deinococcus radiomollis TaxID=468916 RepID=UPI003892ABD2